MNAKNSSKSSNLYDIRGAIHHDCKHYNLSIKAIAGKYKVAPKTVIKWKKRDSLEDKTR